MMQNEMTDLLAVRVGYQCIANNSQTLSGLCIISNTSLNQKTKVKIAPSLANP